MEVIEYVLRYILCFLAIAVILNCVWSLIRLRPDKKVYAVLVDMSNDKQYPMTCYEASVGRSKLCDIIFTNSTVSRSHAVVALRKDGFYVFDTESKSGVYVNEKKIEKSEKLNDGDIIAFGTAIMKFYIGNDGNNDYSHKKEKKQKEQRQPKLVNLADDVEFPIDGDFDAYMEKVRRTIEIAKMLNMQLTVYQRYERGEREVPLWVAIKLADYYGVTLDHIAGRDIK